MTKIMFVCLGNICRSPLAHAVMAHQLTTRNLIHQFQLESSGTAAYHVGEPADSRMRQVAASHGVSIDHLGRHLKKADLDHYDLILAMDNSNYRDILKLAHTDEQRQKVKLFRTYDPQATAGRDVPDPYYGGQEGFEEVFRITERTCAALIDELTTARKP